MNSNTVLPRINNGFNSTIAPTYVYEAFALDSNYHTNVIENDRSRRSRVLYNRGGILIVGLQQGKLGVFSFNSLLLQLTASLTLLAVSKTLTDTIATYFCKRKKQYSALKYEDPDPNLLCMADSLTTSPESDAPPAPSLWPSLDRPSQTGSRALMKEGSQAGKSYEVAA